MTTPESSQAVKTISLQGSAVQGVSPPASRDLMQALPTTVKLGRISPPDLQLRKAKTLHFSNYFNPRGLTTPPPGSINRREVASASISRMYLNDHYGDCVIAGKAHALGVWSANELGSSQIVLATDSEILTQYHSVCGPGDNGCVITNVLDYMRTTGFLADGKRYSIDGYVSVDWTNKLETQVVQYIFGAGTIGVNLPVAWTQNAIWDVTDTGIVGGHDVTPIDYDENGVYVASWGRIYQITWAAWQSKRWLEEYYAVLAPLWYAKDNLSPSGIDVAGLKADLDALGGGTIPDIGPTPPTPPTPPDPPPVPTPVNPIFHLTFSRSVRSGQRVMFNAPVPIPAGTYDVVPRSGRLLIGTLSSEGAVLEVGEGT